MAASFKRDKNGNPVLPPSPQITPVFTPGVATDVSDVGFVEADLVSMDDFSKLHFLIEPSEFDLSGDTTWDKPGVIFASPQPGEYRSTNPTVFVIHAYFDAYGFAGIGGTIKPEIDQIEHFRRRVPGKNRAHIVMYMQGATTFTGKVTSYHGQTRRLSRQGAFLQALGVEIVLEEEKWNGL